VGGIPRDQAVQGRHRGRQGRAGPLGEAEKDNAEKIKGNWVGGADRKRIVKQAKNLVSEGVKQLDEGQTTTALKKFEEAINIYPQSFEGNFWLGLYYLKKSTYNEHARFDLAHLDQAIKTLENASRIAPNSSSVWSNLAIGYAFKNRNKEAIQTAYKAATMHESEATVQNLMSCIGHAPSGTRDQAWCKPICENAVLMAERHKVQGGGWFYVPPAEGDEIPGADSPAGSVWSGSGFFVTTDGYLITNHHVATGEPKTPIKPEITFRVRLDDGTEKTAELIAVDDAADIAVMKIAPDAPVVPFKLADYYPEQGAEALVLGYPATGESEHTLEISNGTVKSVHEADEHEVWFNLNTTHGNSGGPIVDSANNVIAILTAGRESFNMVITLGVSSQQIKTFLTKIGDKAPKVEWAKKPSPLPPFSSENLTKSARGSTVLVIAVRSSD
jgi:S1-C subfamily serine protease